MKLFDSSKINRSFTYEQYGKLLEELYAERKTTGDNHSEDMLNYAKMNLQRMSRLNKTTLVDQHVASALSTLNREQIWYVISEGWCGDAAQNLPPIAKIANSSDKVELQIFLRDENLEIMDQFLTNGGRSIPKLIATDKVSGKILGSWGPRPTVAQNKVVEFKKKSNGDYKEFQKELQLWYAKDKTKSLQEEFSKLITDWEAINKG